MAWLEHIMGTCGGKEQSESQLAAPLPSPTPRNRRCAFATLWTVVATGSTKGDIDYPYPCTRDHTGTHRRNKSPQPRDTRDGFLKTTAGGQPNPHLALAAGP